MKVLVAGLAKTGTTLLFHRLHASLPSGARYLFEPSRYLMSSDDEERGVLAKILLGSHGADLTSFHSFDRVVLLVRDPRDRLVSETLYIVRDLPELFGNESNLTSFLKLIESKSLSPHDVSFLSILRLQARLAFGTPAAEEPFLVQHVEKLNSLSLAEQSRPDAHRMYYEDLVADRLEGLASFLGLPVAPVPKHPELDRVGRSKTAGDWRNWFTEEDVAYFRPRFGPWMERYGYDDDWATTPSPCILPEHAHEFIRRVVEAKRRDVEEGS